MRPLPISSADAEDYYYEVDPIFGVKQNSEWQGKLAQKLSLEGPVAEEPFLNLINGNDLNGKQVVQDGVSKDGVAEHRAGVDIPFAAPKSVSTMALHCGYHVFVDAHCRAIASTIDYIERNYLYARKTIKGETLAKFIDKGLFAKFMHSTSRENDPHLHTHSFIINMLKTRNGYRAVLNDLIFKNQTLLNSIYQSYLAKNIRELGYGIYMKGQGKWEIAGFKQEWIDIFSKRKDKIDEAVKLLSKDESMDGLDNAKIRDMAQRSSRKKKDVRISKDELLQSWEDQVPRDTIIKSVEKKKRSVQDIKISESESLRTAYNAIHESESTFDKSKVVDVALRISRGKFTIDQMEQTFDDVVDDGEIEKLVTLKNKLGLTTGIYTSEKMRKVEQGIVKMFDTGKNDLNIELDRSLLNRFIRSEFDYMNTGQRKMVEHILMSECRFSMVQGDAGTGKTTAIKAVKNFVGGLNNYENGHECLNDAFISPGKKIQIIGLGFTGIASKELEEKSGVKSFTLHKFLNQPGKDMIESDGNESLIWIVDESSMVGSYQLDELCVKAIEHNAKVVLVGDGKQLQAITAGKMFKDLQKYGHVEPVFLKEVIRQESEHMQKVVGYISRYQEGKDAEGIEKAVNNIRENSGLFVVKNWTERLGKVAERYLEYQDRDQCLIITPLNEDRIELNQLVHDAIMQEENITDHRPYDIRMSVPMVGTDQYFAMNYKVGYKVFVGDSRIKNIKPGQELTICNVDPDRNTITVANDHDDKVVIDLKSNDVQLSVYQHAERNFSQGDKIIFTKNDELIGVQNGLTATIERIDTNGMITVVVEESEKRIKFNPYKFGYFDYGYCMTGHKSQGQTVKDVIFLTNSGNFLNNTEMLYEALTRAKQNAFIYINDEIIDNVLAEFENPQSKSSVLDALHKPADERMVN